MRVRYALANILFIVIFELLFVFLNVALFQRVIFFLGCAMTLTLQSEKAREITQMKNYRFSLLKAVILFHTYIQKSKLPVPLDRLVATLLLTAPFFLLVKENNPLFLIFSFLGIEGLYYASSRVTIFKN